MIEILTTQPLLNFDGDPIMSFDLAVANGTVIEIPVIDPVTGEQRAFTFKEAVYRALCRVPPETLTEAQKYEHGCLTAKVMSPPDRIKLDAKEITIIREASGAQRPGSSTVTVHWALVRVLEGEVGQDPSALSDPVED